VAKRIKPIKGIKPIRPIKPIKPINKNQNVPGLPKLGQGTTVAGHWRYNYATKKYEWVKAHWRK
jgi:hypothetical protein